MYHFNHTNHHLFNINYITTTTQQQLYGPFSGTIRVNHLGKLVPEENFWTLWCKGRLPEADTPIIRLGAAQSGLTSAHLQLPPILFLQDGCPFCRSTNSVKALKAT